LGWEQGGELHIERGSRRLHIILALLIHRLCIYRRNVNSATVPISISAHRELIRTVCTVGEASVAVRRFRGMAGESACSSCTWSILNVCCLRLLHPEKMRWQDKAVPHKR
jgi:hypothetical protein